MKANALVLFAAISFAGCGKVFGPHLCHVSGSVFIVQQSGENVKLGLVRVTAYRDTILDPYRTHLAEELVGTRKRIQNQYDKLELEDEKLRDPEGLNDKERDAFKAHLEQDDVRREQAALGIAESTEARASIAGNLRFIDAACRALGADLDKVNVALTAQKQKSSEMESNRARLRLFRPEVIDRVFETLPPSSLAAVTDADGRFVIDLPTDGKFLVVARASRMFGSQTERYSWIVPVDNSKEAAQLMLANDNLYAKDVIP